MDYQHKYIKYKTKYLDLKENNQTGGAKNNQIDETIIFIIRHAQTDFNKKKVGYDDHKPEHDIPINKTGITQAKLTGCYLSKYYKNFDIIYSSPRRRVMQTASIIAKETGYNKKIIKSDLLLEGKAGKFHGLNATQYQKLQNKNKKIRKLNEKLESITDPILKTIKGEQIYRKIDNIGKKEFNTTPFIEIMENYEKFIDMINKTKYKKILIVAHSGTVHGLLETMFGTNISYGEIVDDNLKNCVISCVKYTNKALRTNTISNNKKFYLISKPNNIHLQSMYVK